MRDSSKAPNDGDPEAVNASRTDHRLAYGILRLTFGLNIFFHGLSRLLGDRAAFLAYLAHEMERAPFPPSLLPPFAAILPWVEAAVGFLLLLGLFTRFALVAGALLITALMAGVTLAQDWATAGVQLIYCVIYFLLLTYRDRNFYSLDTWLSIAKRRGR